jgi:hypothetical protein
MKLFEKDGNWDRVPMAMARISMAASDLIDIIKRRGIETADTHFKLLI